MAFSGSFWLQKACLKTMRDKLGVPRRPHAIPDQAPETADARQARIAKELRKLAFDHPGHVTVSHCPSSAAAVLTPRQRSSWRILTAHDPQPRRESSSLATSPAGARRLPLCRLVSDGSTNARRSLETARRGRSSQGGQKPSHRRGAGIAARQGLSPVAFKMVRPRTPPPLPLSVSRAWAL